MKNKIALGILIAIVLFAFVGAFARVMSGFDHNEHMYIAASILVSGDQELYKDFAYLQMPYLPLLYGNLYKLLGVTSYYFLIGKLISFLFIVISSAILFFLSHKIINDFLLSLGILALFLLNMTIINPAREVSNYIMPVAFSMAGFYLFYASINRSHIKKFGIILSGIFLAISIGLKLTYIAVIIPFAIVIILYPIARRSSEKTTVKDIIYDLAIPFIVGITIGILPIFLFMSDIKLFTFNNLTYHSITAQWRQIIGYKRNASPLSKLDYARQIYFEADNLILLFGIILGLFLSIKKDKKIKQLIERQYPGQLLAFLLVFFTTVAALAPTPPFPQYFAMPVSFLFILLVFSLSSKFIGGLVLDRVLLLLILVVMAVIYNGPLLFNSIVKLTHRDGWTALAVHDDSMSIRNALISNDLPLDGKVATLSPLFIMESNLNIYPELATGPFLYRIGDLLTQEQRNHVVGTSPETISTLFSEDPPVAILVGYEGKLDKPLIEYAVANNYRKIDIAGFRGKLYVQP